MEIRVMLFGSAKEIVGAGEVRLDAGPGATTATLVQSLIERYPRLGPWRGSLRVAVNREYAPGETAVSPGDEVAVIPPVSGG